MSNAVNALSAHLRAMEPEDLAERLAVLPDSWARPRPRTLHQVAVRIAHGDALRAGSCTLAELQVLHAVVQLSGVTPRRLHVVGAPSGTGAERRRLYEYLSVPAELVDPVVDRLVGGLLLWPAADVLFPHPGLPEITALRPWRPDQSGPSGPRERFTARPEPDVQPRTDDQAHASAAVASVAALAKAQQTLEILSGPDPWPVRRDDGVGVDQIKRLARLLHTDVREARFWLHVVHHTGMIAARRGQLLVTGHALAWIRQPPEQRLAGLAAAMWTMAALPICDLASRARPKSLVAPLTYESQVYEAPSMRQTIINTAAGLPEGTGIMPGDATAAAVHFAAPELFRYPSRRDGSDGGLGVAAVTSAVLREAELTATIAEGRLTELGRALLHSAGDPGALAAAAAAVLPIRETCMVLADHRVLVTGMPSEKLSGLLDSLAEPAAHPGQAAPAWTITPQSVRRYFDARPGTAPEVLTARLAAASSVPLPQSVEYLITDTARRHGQVVVTSVGSLLETEDPALADELCAAKALAGLGLRRVAPTMLIAPGDLEEVMKTLRAAGYAPAGGDGGEAVVARHAVQPSYLLRDPAMTVPPQTRGRIGGQPAAVRRDHAAWARALSAAEPELGPLATRIAEAAPHLGRLDAATLAAAIEDGGAVNVEYPDYEGPTTLIIRAPRLEGGTSLVGDVAARRRDVLPLPLAQVLLVLPSGAAGEDKSPDR